MKTAKRIVVITGGAGGIGRATAARLASPDSVIVLIDHDRAALDQALSDMANLGTDMQAQRCDISQRTQLQATIEGIVADLGGIDVLINAAGVAAFCSVLDHDEETWDRVIGINLKAAFLCIQAAVPALKRSRQPRIVNITSRAAHKGRPGTVAYSASKGGLLAMTRVLAAELGEFGITVNAVAPGTTLTPMIESTFAGDEAKAVEAEASGVVIHPLRLTEPAEIAGAIAYLCGPEAGHITGTTLHVNGGSFM